MRHIYFDIHSSLFNSCSSIHAKGIHATNEMKCFTMPKSTFKFVCIHTVLLLTLLLLFSWCKRGRAIKLNIPPNYSCNLCQRMENWVRMDMKRQNETDHFHFRQGRDTYDKHCNSNVHSFTCDNSKHQKNSHKWNTVTTTMTTNLPPKKATQRLGAHCKLFTHLPP